MTAPPENARRFPNLPLTRLVPLAAMIEEATKAVVGQLIRLAPPNSATMLGRSVAVISTFIELLSCPSAWPFTAVGSATTVHLPASPSPVRHNVKSGSRFADSVDKSTITGPLPCANATPATPNSAKERKPQRPRQLIRSLPPNRGRGRPPNRPEAF